MARTMDKSLVGPKTSSSSDHLRADFEVKPQKLKLASAENEAGPAPSFDLQWSLEDEDELSPAPQPTASVSVRGHSTFQGC